ncbi:MAG: hypothetical protein VW016_05205 [Luminiphilus sp.]
MLSSHDIFLALVTVHIVTGSVGLITFWIPVVGRKGGRNHRRFGQLFINALLATGLTALAIATTTLFDPVATHPHLSNHDVFGDPQMISVIFGWMMLYLATLTVNLAWHGRLALMHRTNHAATGTPVNFALQVLLTVAAGNCLLQGYWSDQIMVMAMSLVGFATVATNLWFIFKPQPRRHDYIKEHIKSLVGAGISVYTAFFAFGAVRLMPELALTPGLWAVPLVTGLILIIYHQQATTRRFQARGASAA